MKKTISFLFIILLLPTILAVELNIKSEYLSGETMMAKVSGNFIEQVNEENIFFYRENVRVPFLYNVAKIDDDFYIYALLPELQTSANYSIVIKNVQYMQGTKVLNDEIKKEFLISNQTAVFSVSPGFVVAKQDFFIAVQNLQDKEIKVKANSKEEIAVKSGEIKKINFELKNFKSLSLDKIELSADSFKYEIPLYVAVDKEEIKEQEKQKEEVKTYKPETIKTCSQLEGAICKSNEKCSGESIDALDAKCCLGTCAEAKKTPTGKIIGWLIIILVFVFLYLFLTKKYRKTRKTFDLMKIATGGE